MKSVKNRTVNKELKNIIRSKNLNIAFIGCFISYCSQNDKLNNHINSKQYSLRIGRYEIFYNAVVRT